jgi:hypothetical protein
MTESNNGWDEHRISILHRLNTMDQKLDRIEHDLGHIQKELSFSRGRTYTISAFVAVIVSVLTAFGSKFWG